MANWGSSLFLQSIGWATLNSFWQMALLWCIFQLATHFLRLSSNRKYLLAVYSVFLGFSWFIYNLSTFYSNGLENTAFSKLTVEVSKSQFSLILSAASVTYLFLLVFPTYTIIRNWISLKKIKNQGLQKADFTYRVFTQKISQHLGIQKPVKLHVSHWITSPLTIGFLKPVILLPIAAVNNLSTQQMEAILLHELSHIKRQDYIINLLLSIVQTILYFNPFVKLFLKRIEIERENCCDELVLQFEYDKHSYAAALLQLQKNNQHVEPALVMAAAHKNHLLHRIEKIVGIKRKPSFDTTHFAGAFAAVMLLFVINSVLVAGKDKLVHSSFTHFSESFTFFANERDQEQTEKNQHFAKTSTAATKTTALPAKGQETAVAFEPMPITPSAYEPVPPAPVSDFIHVSADEAELALNQEQKEVVGKTVANTRKVLEKNWQEIEKTIGDDMTAAEKVSAKQEYLKEVEKIDWKKLEKGLKIQYQNINWDELNATLAHSLAIAEIDSLHDVYSKVAVELNKLSFDSNCSKSIVAIPDVSVHQIEKAKCDVKRRMEELNKLKAKKTVVRL